MKKFLLIVPFIAIAVYFVFFASEKEINKNIDYADNQIMAVNFIGGTQEYYDYSKAQWLFPNNDFETIEFEGSEKYLIMPRYYAPVYVYSVSFEGNTITKEFVKEIKGNFFVTCNISDILPNVLLETTVNGEFYSYSPCLSGKDGSVITEDFVKLI